MVATLEDTDSKVVEPTLWLGSAVRIEPPTQLVLRRQSGNHVLIVGQDETLALGILATSMVAIAAQKSPLDARFTVLDGTRPESAEQGAWRDIAGALPGSVDLIEPRAVANLIASLAEEVKRRGQSPCLLYTSDAADE